MAKCLRRSERRASYNGSLQDGGRVSSNHAANALEEVGAVTILEVIMSNPIHDESLLRGFVSTANALNRLRNAIAEYNPSNRFIVLTAKVH
jgi:hypothetical protein